ncbi:MAG TPA: ribonuclease R [Verrucomicrobiae bacterium]|nr:ribonuclease R [Verrucomicrobiae bacterium]
MKEQILRLLEQKDYVPLSAENLRRHLRVPPDREPEFERTLRKLEREGQIVRIKADRYVRTSDADLIPGRIRMNRAGKGFLQPDDTGLKEIAIAESATGTALHEDRVLVRRDVRRKNFRDGDQETGTVVRILERKRTQIVGTLAQGRNSLYVIPDDPRMPHDIYVPPARDVGRPARVGDKVVVELREWESRHTSPEGEIVEVLGAPDAEGVDMLSVLRQYDLPLHFPKAVLHEAHAIGSTVHPHDLKDRLDCRAHNVITIDPDDAKDFDDAICLERVSPEQWRLWVHIADVSHYVKPGTALDEEAQKRGNSTYLVDRVIPMLPEALSNELCSLKPNVDRLTKCVEFLVANDGHVLSTKFHSAVIHSQRRFAYKQVLEILQRAPTDDPIEQMLHRAHELAQKIRRSRFKNGSLELDFPEMKIRLDEQGKILRIEKNENDVSHQLIEEYMLLANEAVATRLMHLRTPAIYRIHEEPDARRLQEYRQDVLSHNVPCGNLSQPAEIQKLLHKLGTLPIGAALKIGFLKSLMRARYAVEPLGHYGLAKKKYTHFTSPIRRYADLVVHRALFDKNAPKLGALKPVAEHISVTERNSADAERDSKDVKLFAFLKAQLESGDPIKYPALVTDVRNFGFFVDVPGLAMSGLVPLSTIQDDFYVFDESRSNLVGRRTRRVIGLGDRLTVQVAKVDSFKKQVDFCLAAGEGKVAAPRPPGSRPNAARPQPQPQRGKYPQSSRRDSKRPPSSRPENSRRQDSRKTDSRPGKSQTARRSEERPQTPNKPAMFQTSGSKFSTTQRPLIKASGSSRFSRRRR